MTANPQTSRAHDHRGGWLAGLAAALMTGALLLLLAYTQSFHFMPLAALWQPLGVAVAVALGVWCLLLALTRSPAEAGVVCVALLLFNHALHAPLFGWLQYAARWPAPLTGWRLPVLLASLPGVALQAKRNQRKVKRSVLALSGSAIQRRASASERRATVSAVSTRASGMSSTATAPARVRP